MTVTIPAEYIWRDIRWSDEVLCRVFGISEGAFTLLGNVFMDGLFTVHDQENKRVGLAVADNCPNGVTLNKNIAEETMADKSFCDCVAGREACLAATYKPCYFWQW